jgi:hypothetical protein
MKVLILVSLLFAAAAHADEARVVHVNEADSAQLIAALAQGGVKPRVSGQKASLAIGDLACERRRNEDLDFPDALSGVQSVACTGLVNAKPIALTESHWVVAALEKTGLVLEPSISKEAVHVDSIECTIDLPKRWRTGRWSCTLRVPEPQ